MGHWHAAWACQRDIYRVGMPAKVVTRLKQGDVSLALQSVSHSQPGNSGADDGNFGERCEAHARAGCKNVAKRPEANKGGREEENRFRISLSPVGLLRLRNHEKGGLVAKSTGLPVATNHPISSRIVSLEFPAGALRLK